MSTLSNSTVAVSSSEQEELDAVTSLLVQHPCLVEAYQKLRQALTLPDGYGILLVVGPPGGGKRALASACGASVPLGPSLLSPSGEAVRRGRFRLLRWLPVVA